MDKEFNPTFSVITVTYNAESTLEATIKSVISQTYKNIEYIIVDGYSNDNTLNIVEEYKTHIKALISEPDKGLYDAMNKGIELATGNYICFLNAGDTFHAENTLQLIIDSVFKEMNSGILLECPDILYGETIIVDSDHNFLRKRRLAAPEVLTWKSFKNGMLVCHQALFVKAALVESYNLDYRFSSDFDWSIRMLKKAKSIYNTKLTIIDYLEEGLTTRNQKASLKERFSIMAKYYGKFSTILYHIWFVIRIIIKR